jgi:hypothetical protein
VEHAEDFVHFRSLLSMQVRASVALMLDWKDHAQHRKQSTLKLTKLLIKIAYYALAKEA